MLTKSKLTQQNVNKTNELQEVIHKTIKQGRKLNEIKKKTEK